MLTIFIHILLPGVGLSGLKGVCSEKKIRVSLGVPEGLEAREFLFGAGDGGAQAPLAPSSGPPLILIGSNVI